MLRGGRFGSGGLAGDQDRLDRLPIIQLNAHLFRDQDKDVFLESERLRRQVTLVKVLGELKAPLFQYETLLHLEARFVEETLDVLWASIQLIYRVDLTARGYAPFSLRQRLVHATFPDVIAK